VPAANGVARPGDTLILGLEALPSPWLILWVALGCLGLGVLAALLGRCLPFRDRTSALLASGAAVGGWRVR